MISCFSGDGDEEGREGGEEQQQAAGHTPRRGERRENQGWQISKKPKKMHSMQALHEWIEQLCDPEENFCESLRARLERGWDAEVEQDPRVSWEKDKDKGKDKDSEKGKREWMQIQLNTGHM